LNHKGPHARRNARCRGGGAVPRESDGKSTERGEGAPASKYGAMGGCNKPGGFVTLLPPEHEGIEGVWHTAGCKDGRGAHAPPPPRGAEQGAAATQGGKEAGDPQEFDSQECIASRGDARHRGYGAQLLPADCEERRGRKTGQAAAAPPPDAGTCPPAIAPWQAGGVVRARSRAWCLLPRVQRE